MEPQAVINAFHAFVVNKEEKSWVLYENGTGILFTEPTENLVEEANKIMKEYGPYEIGTPSADFRVITLEPNYHGYVITGQYPTMLVYVDASEAQIEPMAGAIGRAARGIDANELNVIDVRDVFAK